MNADVEEAVSRFDGGWEKFSHADWQTIRQALRDQEAEIARLHRLLMDERYSVPAHLGAEQ